MPMFNAGQFRWQWIAARAVVLTRRDGRFLLVFQLGDDGGAIFVAGIDKQITLFARQDFTLAAEADAFMVRQFEDEFLYLQFTPFEFGVPFDELQLQC